MIESGLPANSVGEAVSKIELLEKEFGSAWPMSLIHVLCYEFNANAVGEKDHLLRIAEDIYVRYHYEVEPNPTVIKTLRTLKDRGFILGVISNALASEQIRRLENANLFRYFDHNLILISSDFYSPDDIGNREWSGLDKYHEIPGIFRVEKPWLTLYKAAVARTTLKPSEIMFVGDLSSDIIGANLAGFRSVLLKGETRYSSFPESAMTRLNLSLPNFSISCASDLLDLLNLK